MRIEARWLIAGLACVPATVLAQPTLSSLWPHADGSRWDYEISIVDAEPLDWTGPGFLQFDGTVETAGGTAQVLVAEHATPTGKRTTGGADVFLASVWRARPDLRAAITARYGDQAAGDAAWYPLLVHGGYFIESAAALHMWQAKWNHATWTYATDNLTVGAQFTQQLIPELADDVYLHGTVEAIDATVATPVETFAGAVRIAYEVDYGWSEDTGEDGTPLGRFIRSRTQGHVHFVPDVGPVEMHEEFILYAEIDCGAEPCPPEWLEGLGTPIARYDMGLTGTTVGVHSRTFTQMKALYR